MRTILETERLRLRPFRESDIEPFSAYRSDPEVARYQGWETPYTVAQATNFVQGMMHVRPGTPGQWFQQAIVLRATGELVGDCASCVWAGDPQQADIGITLARRHQGQGYATEALSRLYDFLFGELGLHRLRSICDVENLASARLMERLGMRREAHMVENIYFKGRWASEFWFGILRREWLARPARR